MRFISYWCAIIVEKCFSLKKKIYRNKKHDNLYTKFKKVDSKYLYYLLNFIDLPQRGAAQPFISKGDINKFNIGYLPPLDEQKRIVAKLDVVFGEIDKAIDVSKQKLEELHQLRSSILTQELKSETA